MKTNTLILASFLMISLYSQTSDKSSFEAWDADRNGKIDKNEYSINSDLLDTWDDTGDNLVSLDEFQDSYFALFDNNSNGKIDSDEMSNLYFLLPSDISMVTEKKGKKKDRDKDKSEDMRYGAGTETLAEWDIDKNEVLDKNEFNSKINNVFSSWDGNSDGYLSNTELYDNTYKWWDIDSNDNIEKSEFEEMKKAIKDRSLWEKIF